MEPLVSLRGTVSTRARCAFCHDALGAAWDVCVGCNTRLHPECREQAVECPTLGCRMSALRRCWTSPRQNPRPSFRRALANMTHRHESAALRLVEEEEEPPASALRAIGTIFAHALLSPFALVAFIVFFIFLYAPAHWTGVFARAPEIAAALRRQARGPAAVFTLEASFAPFFAVSFAALPAIWAMGGVAPVFIALAEVVLAAIVVVPAAASWFEFAD